jgi:uncharacterized protein YndB with AHSA1/START domain
MTNTNFKVDITKQLQVPLEKLYSAWTQPEDLKQWWKPMHKQLKEVTNDLHEGGQVKYIFDDSLEIEGTYSEVKEKQRLVYSWNWHLPKDDVKDSCYQLTVEFSGTDEASVIHVIQENFESEEGTLPHKEGWEKGLNDLEAYLKGG